MILRSVPREEWPQLRLKMCAASVLRGKRASWGQNRKWEGNYLARPQDNPNSAAFQASINNLRNVDKFQMVLFSSYIQKTNRFNKAADRALLITDTNIYKLETKKFKSMRKGSPIAEVTGLSLSPGRDQLVVIHSNKGNDLVVALHTAASDEDRVGELVGILCSRYQQLRNMELKVTVSSQFHCMLGNKSRPVHVEVCPEIQAPNFKPGKDADIVYAVPSSYAVVGGGDRNGQQYNHKIGWKA